MTRYIRAGAALAGAAAILAAVAAPATAEPANGNVDPDKHVTGYQVNVGAGWLGNIHTKLLALTLSDGNTLGMYCVEIETEIDEEHGMVERPWEEYPNADSPFNDNRAKINWVLHNGYPTQSLDALAAALPSPPNDGIDVLEAIAATQSAVWHFSDDVDLNRQDPLTGGAADAEDKADVLALYDYLTGEANTGIGESPIPTLEISPNELDGAPGSVLGPFTVSTTATIEELKTNLPAGVELTDGSGAKLGGTLQDGAQVFVRVPAGTADGEGSFEVTASTSIETGRLFVGENYDREPTQSLIVAKSQKTELTATANVRWSAAPATTTSTPTSAAPSTTVAPSTTSAAPVPQARGGDLAETGASVFTPILIGVVLLGVGIGALLFVRRRRA